MWSFADGNGWAYRPLGTAGSGGSDPQRVSICGLILHPSPRVLLQQPLVLPGITVAHSRGLLFNQRKNWSIGGSMTWVCSLSAASNRSRLVCWVWFHRGGGSSKLECSNRRKSGEGKQTTGFLVGCHLTLILVVKGVQSHTLRGKATFPPRPPGILQPEGIRFPLQALCWSNGKG